MVEFLPPNRLLVGGELAANLRHLRWHEAPAIVGCQTPSALAHAGNN